MNYIPIKPFLKEYQEKHFHDNRVLEGGTHKWEDVPSMGSPMLSSGMSEEGFQDRIPTPSPNNSPSGLFLENWESAGHFLQEALPDILTTDEKRNLAWWLGNIWCPGALPLISYWSHATALLSEREHPHPHYLSKEMKAQRKEMTCPTSHNVWCSQLHHSTRDLPRQTWGHLQGNPSQVPHTLWALVSPFVPWNSSSLSPSLSWWGFQPDHP